METSSDESKHRKDKRKNKKKECEDKPGKNKCLDRVYIYNSAELKCSLAYLNEKSHRCNDKCHRQSFPNEQEADYFTYNFVGSFHKSLQHDETTGLLSCGDNYVKMVKSLLAGNQGKLASVPLAYGSQLKLVDPLASLSTPLIGVPPCKLLFGSPPTLSSNETGAEMVELYSMVLSRDVPFINYCSTSSNITQTVGANTLCGISTAKSGISFVLPTAVCSSSLVNMANLTDDSTIEKVLGYLNVSDVLCNLPFLPRVTACVKPGSKPPALTCKTIFRGNSVDTLFGPHISQLFYLSIPMAGLNNAPILQKYAAYPTKDVVISNGKGTRNEWGINRTEIIGMQNGRVSSLPPADATTAQYIYSGRALSEVVNLDKVTQFYYQASMILQYLNTPLNPSIPTYPNQQSFISLGGDGFTFCSIGELAGIALQTAWWFKWQLYRRVRPEVVGLWVDNVKNNVTPNFYNLSDNLLNSDVLAEIKAANLAWDSSNTSSYTLSQDYRSGCPVHPESPSGHATIAGALSTLLKMVYNGEKLWSGSTLPGLITDTKINPLAPTVYIQSNSTGDSLTAYSESDTASMTLQGEINKFGENIAIGRDWAGVHTRYSSIASMKLGEQVTVAYMGDKLSSMVQNSLCGFKNERPPCISFVGFDGQRIDVKPTICKKSKCGGVYTD